MGNISHFSTVYYAEIGKKIITPERMEQEVSDLELSDVKDEDFFVSEMRCM